jgi:hypothetical protein
MKKAVKIILFIIVALVVILAIIIAVNVILANNFYKNAEDLGGYAFGAGSVNATINGQIFDTFNSKLKNCELAYGGISNTNWKIIGIKKDSCKLVYTEPDMDNNDCYNYGDCEDGMMTVSYKTYVCYLPESVYSYPDKISWSSYLENEEFCFVQ